MSRHEQTGDAGGAGSSRGSQVRCVTLISLVAALGGLLFGYDTAVINGAIGYLSVHFQLDAFWKGWATASALVGCIVGACFAGVLSDRFGRKKVMLLSAVLFAVSAVWSAVPRGLAEFAWARMIGGFGVGAASILSPLYIAEISPARIRGRLVSVNQLTIVSGMLVVYFVNAIIAARGEATDLYQAAGAAMQDLNPKSWNVLYGWRWMFGSETLPAVLFLICLLFVPESPRWLVKQHRHGEALRVLTRVNGADGAARESAAIANALAQEHLSLRQLFRPGIRFALLLGVILAVLQQITGINVILYYGAEIFQGAGLKSTHAIYQTVIVGAVNVAFTLVAIWVVDKLGRKPLLLCASAGMGLSLFLVGALYTPGKTEGPWVLIFILTYVASFAVAMGPVVWVVLSEIFPTRVRGAAMSVAVVCLWTANFLVTQFYPPLMDALGGKAYHLFGAICVVAFLFVAWFIPETKGKTLEEIERRWLPVSSSREA